MTERVHLRVAVKALDELSELVSLFCCFCTAGLAHGWEDGKVGHPAIGLSP